MPRGFVAQVDLGKQETGQFRLRICLALGLLACALLRVCTK
jgi:hypothetical protein